MARVSTSSRKGTRLTQEGARASTVSPELHLRRSVLACMLARQVF